MCVGGRVRLDLIERPRAVDAAEARPTRGEPVSDADATSAGLGDRAIDDTSDGPYPTQDEMTAANAGLVAVVRRQLPQRFYAGESYWAVFRAAALLRMADTVESVMGLMASRHDLDGQTLVRSLYEQVVTFAWIAIDPDARFGRWVGEGTSALLKLHNDAVVFGESILSEDEVVRAKAYLGLSAEARREAAESCQRRGRGQPDPERVLPPATDRARQADEHWSTRINGLHPTGHLLSLRGLYLGAYRIGSRSTHGSMLALDPYVSIVDRPVGRQFVVDRGEPQSRVTWATVGPLFGIALLIAAEDVRWIDERAVRELIDRSN